MQNKLVPLHLEFKEIVSTTSVIPDSVLKVPGGGRVSQGTCVSPSLWTDCTQSLDVEKAFTLIL